ncbi:MAG: aminotransferase class V-fold PLP-dependent enzyme [Cucumibacter sp.]
MDKRSQTYLDHNASSPLLPAARTALIDALEMTGNPSSVHRHGRALREVIEAGRDWVAEQAGTEPERVIFTGSGTEALTQGIVATARAGLADRIVISTGEHQASLKAAEAAGVPATTVGLTPAGEIDLAGFGAILTGAGSDRLLIALHQVNNETGVVQPLAEIEAMLAATPHILLVDAVQGFGKLDTNFDASRADMLAISAHKIGGPAGIGALIVKDRFDTVRLIPGGGQQQGRRGGTEPAALAAAFGVAARAARTIFDLEKLRGFTARIEAIVMARVPGAVVFGRAAKRLGTTVNFAIPGLASATALIGFDLAGVSISAGSACSSGKMAKSHVLKAMGVDHTLAGSAVRVSTGWSTTGADIDHFAAALDEVMARHEAAAAA